MFEWITNDIEIEVMIKVMIKKNDETIKVMECMESTLQHTFNLAHDIAGGMWNGKDKIKVIINK